MEPLDPLAEIYQDELSLTEKPKSKLKLRKQKEAEFDLLKMESEFVEGIFAPDGSHVYPSLEQLLIRFSIHESHLSTIRRHAMDNSWRLKREGYKDKLIKLQQVEKAREIAKRKESFDVDCLKIAEVGISQIKVHMMKYMAAKEAVPVKDLERLARTFQKFQIAGKLSLGDRIQDMVNTVDTKDDLDSQLVGLDLDNLDKDELRQMSSILERAAAAKEQKLLPGGEPQL